MVGEVWVIVRRCQYAGCVDERAEEVGLQTAIWSFVRFYRHLLAKLYIHLSYHLDAI
jgi:hypothetical protein